MLRAAASSALRAPCGWRSSSPGCGCGRSRRRSARRPAARRLVTPVAAKMASARTISCRSYLRSRSVMPSRCGAGPLVGVAEHQPALELAADAFQRRAGQHPLRRAALADIEVDAGLRIGGVDHPGHVAVGDQVDPRARPRAAMAMISAWRGRSSTQTVISRGIDALGLGQGRGRCRPALLSRSITPGRIAGAAGDLVHIGVGRVAACVPAGAQAITARALAMALAVRVVPSSGSSAISIARAVAASRPSRRCRASAPRRARPRR